MPCESSTVFAPHPHVGTRQDGCDLRGLAGAGEGGVRVGSHRPADRESPLHLTLAQGISRGERMDYTLQKAVELGVSRIVPIASEHPVVRLSAERGERRTEHWARVVQAACEQCGRTRVPRP